MAEATKPPFSQPPASNEDWRPSASPEALRLRAELLSRLRGYFAEQGVLEVETPLLASAGVTDPHIPSFTVVDTDSSQRHRYLNTSPEFAMKRLLAAGIGPIYQICKAFRRGEIGRHHNPEFTLLEWYRPGFDHHRLMRDVDSLVKVLMAGKVELGESQFITYHECFQQSLGIDPHTATAKNLRVCAQENAVPEVCGLADDERDAWLDILMSHCIQPHLGQGHLCFVYHYPESQAALARIQPGNPPVAERFELFHEGVELANGFHELQHADEQRQRFEAELVQRRAEGQEPMIIDERLLSALHSGLPDCAGVALGMDRLQMVLTKENRIKDVLAFDYLRS
ncbi:MAG: EF-P lysine aminoacylase GenX [Ectothiorhodospiraceae bacterium]|nr:EF-P lysine aminoacylase GenX [Ectothiorhodospiraceae bacterium]